MRIPSLIGHGAVALVIALLGCSSGRGPSGQASTGTAGGAGGDSSVSAGGSGGVGAGGAGGASSGGAGGAVGAAGAGGSTVSSGVGGSAGVAAASDGGSDKSPGDGGSAAGSGGSPVPCGGSTCAAGLVCARGAEPACIDASWANWPVPSGAAHENGDGTVTDLATGLMWEKMPAAGAGDAAAAAAACAALMTAAYADWRLPAITELLSIVDYDKSAPALDTVFSSTPDVFLSATPSIAADGVWAVDFNSGESFVSASGRRRCVR